MIRNNLINACRDVKECAFACFKPSSKLETLCADIRSAIGTSVRIKNNNRASTYNVVNEDEETFYTDQFEGIIDEENQNQDHIEDHEIEAMIADMILDENLGQAPESAMTTQ
ncbi:hypothetical protein Golomagni_05076 [Golovinomyces magnicellulatus]|nr:hypothetical protein Golomagni_05076 [Golovinomyces magnicellulatus]